MATVTPMQLEVLKIVARSRRDEGYSPTYKEIGMEIWNLADTHSKRNNSDERISNCK